jgi:hypothetical protein
MNKHIQQIDSKISSSQIFRFLKENKSKWSEGSAGGRVSKSTFLSTLTPLGAPRSPDTSKWPRSPGPPRSQNYFKNETQNHKQIT